MKTLRFILVGTALIMTCSLFGRTSSFFELSVGGGWSSLGYHMDNQLQPDLSARQNGSYGLNAHFAYGFQFNKYIGLGVGVDFSRYGATAQLNGDAKWLGVTDTDREMYDHITTVTNWRDVQQIYILEVPMALYLRFPIATDVRIFGEIGAKIGLPMTGKGKYSGNLKHSGFYEPWMLTLNDVSSHGFYSSSMKGDYTFLTNKLAVAGFVKIGVEAPVDELRHVWIFGAIYSTMYFMPVFASEHNVPLGWRNDTYNADQLKAHAFMNEYNPIIYTNSTRGNANPLSIGVEIGIRFRLPHIKRYSGCMCEEE